MGRLVGLFETGYTCSDGREIMGETKNMRSKNSVRIGGSALLSAAGALFLIGEANAASFTSSGGYAKRGFAKHRASQTDNSAQETIDSARNKVPLLLRLIGLDTNAYLEAMEAGAVCDTDETASDEQKCGKDDTPEEKSTAMPAKKANGEEVPASTVEAPTGPLMLFF